ncbi:MAG: DUF805 domain-containing protein [Methylobacteriaceae bacterium]|nr:DUF805 domain-containing protein [Methylobacteriaceae bacterium]
MPRHFLWFLFDWRGRVARGPYRIAVLVLALFVTALELAPEGLHRLLVGVLILQLVVQAALDAKRLHDIGFSAMWVAISSLGCIAGAAALASQAPEALELIGQHVHEILGPAADKGGPLAIALAGLEAAALLRTSLLWIPKSNAGGDAYDFAPGLRGATIDESASKLDADALIARALAEESARAADSATSAAAGAQSPRSQSFGSGGPRKTFGARKSA